MLYSVESAHALLKRYITSSQGDLLTTWLQIRQAVSSQIQNIKENAVKDRIRTPLHLSRAQYQDCFGYITNTALRLADTNYTSSVKPLKPCTGVFKVTTGLPCAHRIRVATLMLTLLYMCTDLPARTPRARAVTLPPL